MAENNVLKLVYTFFLGIIIATFIGIGINTFYPAPEYPEYSPSSYSEDSVSESNNNSDAQYKEYEKKSNEYYRNISIMLLIASCVLVALSLALERKIKVISYGIMLGGLFTLLYSIGTSIAAQNEKYSFLVITAGLAVILYLGYHYFVKNTATITHKNH